MEDSAKEELVLRPIEGVEEQHDEYQRIVFVFVYGAYLQNMPPKLTSVVARENKPF